MPTFPLYTYVAKTNTQIRDDFLRVVKNGLIQGGFASNPNVGPSSDYYLIGSALGNELAVVQAGITITADSLMPDTAGGANLDRILATYGLARNPATTSRGNISTPCNQASTVVAANSQLTDAAGLRYFVTIGGTYTSVNGSLSIPVQSLDTGKATNHANGDALKWASAPPFCASTATVGALGGSDGFTGGNDSEVNNDEPPRARLLAFLQNPPKGGNASEIGAWCAQSSPNIQAGWVYPALLGPGTVFAAVAQQPQTVGPFTSTSKNRDVSSTLMTGTVQPYVQGLIPEHAFSIVATVVNQPVDIAIQLSLPSAPTASPPGAGGGWVDGSPWPNSLGTPPAGAAATMVTAASSANIMAVNASTPPTVGVSHVSWISPLTWTIYSATVIGLSGSSGAYVITLDSPFPGIAAGNYIFPQSQNQSTYLAAILAAFASMGPGEWTSNPTVAVRAFRHPAPAQAWPYALSPVQLKQVISSGPEVLDANWIYRSAVTPTVPGSITVSGGGVLTSAAPSIFVPRNIAFLAQ